MNFHFQEINHRCYAKIDNRLVGYIDPDMSKPGRLVFFWHDEAQYKRRKFYVGGKPSIRNLVLNNDFSDVREMHVSGCSLQAWATIMEHTL